MLSVELKLSVNIYKCRRKCLEQSLHLFVDSQRLNRFKIQVSCGRSGNHVRVFTACQTYDDNHGFKK